MAKKDFNITLINTTDSLSDYYAVRLGSEEKGIKLIPYNADLGASYVELSSTTPYTIENSLDATGWLTTIGDQEHLQEIFIYSDEADQLTIIEEAPYLEYKQARDYKNKLFDILATIDDQTLLFVIRNNERFFLYYGSTQVFVIEEQNMPRFLYTMSLDYDLTQDDYKNYINFTRIRR